MSADSDQSLRKRKWQKSPDSGILGTRKRNVSLTASPLPSVDPTVQMFREQNVDKKQREIEQAIEQINFARIQK